MERRELVTALVDGARAALGDDLLGLHLVGSQALGAGEAHGADGFVAITSDRLTSGQRTDLDVLHARLCDLTAHGAEHLAGSYAPVADLRSPMTVGRAWPHAGRGSRSLELSARDNTAYARWVLRERGVPVLGRAATTYVAPVEAAALRAEMIGVARTRAEDVEEHPELLDGSHQPHLVRQLCRVLHTAYVGEPTSAADAATWALEVVDPQHRPLVREALVDRPAPRQQAPQPADPARAALTRAFAWEVHRMVGAEVLRQAGG